MGAGQEVDLDLIRRYMEQREAEQERLNRIDETTGRLSESVEGLSEALSTYAKAEDVDTALADTASKAELRKARNRTRLLAAALLIAVVALGLSVHSNHNSTKALKKYNTDQQTQAVTRCQQRNQNTMNAYTNAVSVFEVNQDQIATDTALQKALKHVPGQPPLIKTLEKALTPPPPVADPVQPTLPNCAQTK